MSGPRRNIPTITMTGPALPDPSLGYDLSARRVRAASPAGVQAPELHDYSSAGSGFGRISAKCKDGEHEQCGGNCDCFHHDKAVITS